MIATEILKEEHDMIIMALGGAKREVLSVHATRKINSEKVERLIDFCWNFIERCHNAKEEKYLMAKMQERGLPSDKEPILVMSLEHKEGQGMVQAMAAALPQAKIGESTALSSIALNLRAYIGLLHDHIDKENNVFFPLADQLFTPEDQKELLRAFKKYEAEEIGSGEHDRYHQLARELAQE
ncbi:MAG: hemerythrin domain-containing protein [Syntrophales bacterium]